MTDAELHTLTVTVCGLCLDGEEGECHSPGCAFWTCPAPTAEQAEHLRQARALSLATDDSPSRRMLTAYAARHGASPRLGCSLVAHRDLGYCSGCESPHDGKRVDAARELSGWRLLAMAERGIPRQSWESPLNTPAPLDRS